MLIKQDFYFHSLDAHRPLHIRIPDFGEPPFPVMYFFDGHNLFRDEDATYGKSWGLDAFCASWDKPIIIVGVECAHEGNLRLSEYLPYGSRYGWLRNLEPLGQKTMDGIIHELKPYIDSAFPTIPFRECTGIGGSSMGGLMELYGTVMHNHTFSKAACLSSSIGPGMKELMQDIADAPLNPDTRIYLSWGEEEAKYGGNRNVPALITKTAQNNYTLAGLLTQRGCATRVLCQYGGHHCEADWEKQVPGFMRFLWGM